jgi:hypothetical protein
MKAYRHFTTYAIALFAVAGATFFTSCDDDPALPDNILTFETDALGLDEAEEVEVTFHLDRAESSDISLTIDFATENITYGTEFTTDPDGANGSLTVVIPSGSTEGSFRVIKTPGVFLEGDESVTFSISDAGETLVLGETVSVKVSFSAITSTGAELQLSGKTDASPYANTVYVDFSANQQTPVDRKSWNLGFYSGTDFKVVLNPAYQSTAAPLIKTDITTVNITDTETILNLNHDIEDPNTLPLADHWDGDLSKTTFAVVSATESENEVYLLSFEGAKSKDQWFKVKVNRNGDGYRVLYARVGETTIKTLDVPKNAAYNFTFASLETNAVVSAEPAKLNWEIEWSYSTSNSGLNTPYWFQDFILINNVGGAEAVEVVKADAATAETSFNAFAEADLAGFTFSSKRDVIGSKWRTTGGPGGGATGIKRDRFYVVKDPRGNYYKLKFVSMGIGSDGGERGRPVIKYVLVKEAQ